MDHSRQELMRNLARYAATARVQMALTVTCVGRLTGLSPAALEGIERGDADSHCTLDELTGLALFLGLTANGTQRRKPPGATA